MGHPLWIMNLFRELLGLRKLQCDLTVMGLGRLNWMMHQANGACDTTLSPKGPDTARLFSVVSLSMDMGLSLCLGQKCPSALPPVQPLSGASLTPRGFLAIGVLTPQPLPLYQQLYMGPMRKAEQVTGSTASLPGDGALRTGPWGLLLRNALPCQDRAEPGAG